MRWVSVLGVPSWAGLRTVGVPGDQPQRARGNHCARRQLPALRVQVIVQRDLLVQLIEVIRRLLHLGPAPLQIFF